VCSMTIIVIWSVFLGEGTFCEFLVCFLISPFLRFLFGELTELEKDRIARFKTLMNFRSHKILEIVTL